MRMAGKQDGAQCELVEACGKSAYGLYVRRILDEYRAAGGLVQSNTWLFCSSFRKGIGQ
jgi:hypothetical protein